MPEPRTLSPSSDDARGMLADEALDALAFLLRSMGGTGAEPDERDELERWALHVLLQAPVPVSAPEHVTPPGKRDWPRLRARIGAILQSRQATADHAIGTLRDTLTTFTQNLVQALAEDRDDDARARVVLDRLRDAAEHRSVAEVRQHAFEAVEALSDLLAHREERYEKRLSELSERASRLESRLTTAQQEQLIDALTRLTNRRGFDLDLDRAMDAFLRFRERATLLLLDIDHFKQINDTHGHVVGDAVLREFANLLAHAFPRRGDCVARYGGEEFAVILHGSEKVDGHRLAERFLARLRKLEIDLGDEKLRVTCSVGITSVRDGDDRRTLTVRADRALYAAKEGGRDRIVVN